MQTNGWQRRSGRTRGHCHGVTLVEALCVVAVIGILGGLATPQLGQFMRASARTTAVNDFVHAVSLARSKAILTNSVVSICATRDGIACDTGRDYSQGWMVFLNTDRDQPANRDAGEELLWHRTAWTGGRISSNRMAYSFRPTSQADVNGTLVFCDRIGAGADPRAVIISHTGRPRVSKRDASNRPLNCQ